MATRPVGTGGATPHHSRFHYRSEYEIFQPMSEWQQDEESDILILYLPGTMMIVIFAFSFLIPIYFHYLTSYTTIRICHIL